jgi:hypothetical protein
MSEEMAVYLTGNEIEPHRVGLEVDESFETVVTWRVVGDAASDTLSWRFVTNAGRVVVVRPVQVPSNARPVCVPSVVGSALREVAGVVDCVRGRVGARVVRVPSDTEILEQVRKVRGAAGEEARKKWKAFLMAAETAASAPYVKDFESTLRVEALKLAKDARKKKTGSTGKPLPVLSDDQIAVKYIACLKAEVGVDAPESGCEYDRKLRVFVREREIERQGKQARVLKANAESEAKKEEAAFEAAKDKALRKADAERAKNCDSDRGVALYEVNRLIGLVTGKALVSVPQPRKGERYSVEERAKVMKLLTGKTPGAEVLEEVRAFIAEEVGVSRGGPEDEDVMKALEKRKAINADDAAALAKAGPVRDADLRRVLAGINEAVNVKSKKGMRGAVIKAHGAAVREAWPGWVDEVASVRKLTKGAAAAFLSDRVPFIAECDAGRFGYVYPIEAVVLNEVMDAEEVAAYEKAGGLIGFRGRVAEPRKPDREDHGGGSPMDEAVKGVQFDVKAGQLLENGEVVPLRPVPLAIVAAAANEMQSECYSEEKGVDLTGICNRLKKDHGEKFMAGWPVLSGRVSQLFRKHKAYEKFGELFGDKLPAKGGKDSKRNECRVPRFEVIGSSVT